MNRIQPWIDDDALEREILSVQVARTAANEELPPRFERFSQLTGEEYGARAMIIDAADRYIEALNAVAQLRQRQADYLESLARYARAVSTRPPAPQDDAFLQEFERTL